MKQKTLCIVAGGSGGHILPALQLGKIWLDQNKNGKIIFFCSSKKIDQNIIFKYKFLSKVIFLKLSNFPGKKFWRYPKFLFQFFKAGIKSFYYQLKFKPEKVLTTGGHIAIPVCLTAKILRIYTQLHELNVVPGKAIKLLSPFCNQTTVVFDKTKEFLNKNRQIILQNYPVRFNVRDKIFDKNTLIKQIKSFENTRKTIFLLGGSQGSIFLNDLLKESLIRNSDKLNNIQVIHQTGIQDKTNWQAFYKKLNIPALIFSYDENIKNYYLIADLIISRAGAGTLFELEFFKKQSFIIPLKAASTMHQYYNAIEMAKKNPDLFCVQDQDLIKNNFALFEENLFKNNFPLHL